ncbi:MAG TPA: transglycosylase SLT domain-containing protein [Solirubrobacterales bacterium]|nr:transglycosylase SLT domain-containing protein [Solirubrobacterales bacterium]
MAPLIIATHTPAAGSACAEAAAIAVAATRSGRGAERAALLIDATGRRQWRNTLLASDAARGLARGLAVAGEEIADSELGAICVRGRIAVGAVPADPADALRLVDATADCGSQRVLSVLPEHFRVVMDEVPAGTASVMLRSRGGSDRDLAAALSIELRARNVRHKIWLGGLGAIGAGRARAGLEPGGPAGGRARRLCAALGEEPAPERHPPAGTLKQWLRFGSETGQALPALLGLVAVVLLLAGALVALGGAATAKGRAQRAVDLAAVSAARSMRDDFDRLFIPARRPDGTRDPRHLSRAEYLDRGSAAALDAGRHNGLAAGSLRVEFPDEESIAPVRVEVRARMEVRLMGRDPSPAARTTVRATAGIEPGTAGPPGSQAPAVASGGGYSGPLAYRQGKPMRPDVAAAFDRLSGAAGSAGHALIVNSAFRSDAEQAALFAANPDPKWVAPPGRSLHRCATELDLGPPSAHGWLAANAGRFGFVRRYAWEAWHFGFTEPAPCSTAADRASGPARSSGGGGPGDGRAARSAGLPAFVPGFARAPLLSAAARHDVSAELLAAQLLVESNFNPAAVSPAGARGIAQFMPATAAAYGLDDPFDPAAAIAAQARLMSELLGRFGSVQLALAAYNAGPGAVSGCSCVPPYPETQAYVTRILGILDGAGALGASGPPPLEVRLLE